jgi:lantibiotic biosynthesis protein
MEPWIPLLEGAQGRQATDACDRIAQQLLDRSIADDATACALMTGDAGIAVFLAYYARARGDDRAAARAGEILERMAELAVGLTQPSLYSGFAGSAWVFEHLRDMFEIDPEFGDPIDGALLEILETCPAWLSFEWLSGVAGIGVYALERFPRTPALLERVAVTLARMARPTRAGVRWDRPSTVPIAQDVHRFPDGCAQLDPAHGAMGAIGVLAGCVERGLAVQPLLADAVTAVLAQRFPHDRGPVFPLYADDPFRETGMAWCRGDVGVAGVLSAVAERVAEVSWSNIALESALRMAYHVPFVPPFAPGGLCHGYASIAHALNRLARRHDDPHLTDAARDAFTVVTHHLAEDDPSLLTGNAGIGLALLGATTPIAPSWDRVLLLSIRPEA